MIFTDPRAIEYMPATPKPSVWLRIAVAVCSALIALVIVVWLGSVP